MILYDIVFLYYMILYDIKLYYNMIYILYYTIIN